MIWVSTLQTKIMKDQMMLMVFNAVMLILRTEITWFMQKVIIGIMWKEYIVCVLISFLLEVLQSQQQQSYAIQGEKLTYIQDWRGGLRLHSTHHCTKYPGTMAFYIFYYLKVYNLEIAILEWEWFELQ